MLVVAAFDRMMCLRESTKLVSRHVPSTGNVGSRPKGLGYAFDKLGVSGLFAGHNPKNETSRHLLEKLGFRYSHDEYYATTGLNHPSHMMSVVEYSRLKNSDWCLTPHKLLHPTKSWSFWSGELKFLCLPRR